MQAGNLRVLGPAFSPAAGAVASSAKVPTATTGPLLPSLPPSRGACTSAAPTSTRVAAATASTTAALSVVSFLSPA